jgi:hypothetical protein
MSDIKDGANVPTESTVKGEPATAADVADIKDGALDFSEVDKPNPLPASAEVKAEVTETPKPEVQKESADTKVEPEQKVVPYERFKEVNDELKRYKEVQTPAEPEIESPSLDPEVVPALDNWYLTRRAEEKAWDFEQKHADELKDPLLQATTRMILTDTANAGKYIDQEDALAQAKQILSQRLQPQINQAKAQGVEDGQEIARKKEQAGAIGDTGVKQEVAVDGLSAEDYAKQLNIPRAN